MLPLYRGRLPGVQRYNRDAVAAYNSAHARDWGPPGQGTCPICGHHGCFGRLPNTPERWHCFSANHDKAIGADGKPVGIKGRAGYHGDALDVDAYQAATTRMEWLASTGYHVRPSLEAT